MKLKKFSRNTWTSLIAPDMGSGGYQSITLTRKKSDPVIIHLFLDGSGHYHMAIEISKTESHFVEDPNVNGLRIQLVEYQFQNGPTSCFIDLTCSISSYLEEFTEVIREIANQVLKHKIAPQLAVQTVMRNWLTFWGKPRKDTLSEKEQLGLICELIVLEKLCSINPEKALQSWKGPLGEKHDYSFPSWSLEVKGTRRSTRTHTINGIEQLVPPHKKHLGFISFQFSKSNDNSGLSLPTIADSIIRDHLANRPDLTLRFHELMRCAGYSPIHGQFYRQFQFEYIVGFFHIINDSFPKLTSEMLNQALDQHISKIRYDITLEDIPGIDFQKLNIQDFFDKKN